MGESLDLFAGLLPPLEAPSEDDDDDEEQSRPPSWPEIRFELMWHQHGGSGLGVTFADTEELDLEWVMWLSNALLKRRQRETEALRRVAKTPSSSRPSRRR